MKYGLHLAGGASVSDRTVLRDVAIAAEEEGYVPELEDIRDEIVDAWRKQVAFLLAKAEAERLAEEAGDKVLAEVFADREGLEVFEPLEFSWMTIGSTPFGGVAAWRAAFRKWSAARSKSRATSNRNASSNVTSARSDS